MLWTRILENLLLPPAGLAWLGLAGLALLAARRRRWGTGLLAASAAGFYLFATPLVAALLLAPLDRHPPLAVAGELPAAEAVVVLGAGLRYGAREHGGDTVTAQGLERLRYGAWLAERTGRPVLVTGKSGAEMTAAMERSFRVDVRWTENVGRNTHENAVLSARLLRPAGVGRVYLVTHYWHMPRAAAAFRAAGMEPVPAPLGFGETEPWYAMLVPRSGSSMECRQALHEWIGRLWYRLRYGYR